MLMWGMFFMCCIVFAFVAMMIGEMRGAFTLFYYREIERGFYSI